MPMILEPSVQARFLIPMAVSLGFGVMFATGITLLIVPSLYMAVEDVRNVVRWYRGEPLVSTEPAPPAVRDPRPLELDIEV